MKLLLSLLILNFLALGACTKTEIIREPGAGDPLQYGPPPPSNNPTMGPGDSGGGAGVGGRPIESFKVDIRSEKYFVEQVQVVINNLAIVHSGLAADMLHLAGSRGWYIVPVPLNKIPAIQMGIKFVETEQLAIQNLDTVWIDMRTFDKMNEKDQTLLIIHELLMGVRLLEYTDALDLCYANATQFAVGAKNMVEYKNARSSCANDNKKWDMTSDRKKIGISESDYDNIRNLGTMLYKQCFETPTMIDGKVSCDIAPEELEAWIVNKKFRKY